MARKYLSRTIGGLVCVGLVWSASQIQWFSSITGYEESKPMIEDRQEDLPENTSWKGYEFIDGKKQEFEFFYLPKIETVCPEHERIRGYIPITKDPRVIYFWNRERPVKTNNIQKFKYDRRKIGEIV